MEQFFPEGYLMSSEDKKATVGEWLGSGRINIEISRLAPPTARISRERILEGLLLHGWALPSREMGNRIPIKGSSLREVDSASILAVDAANRLRLVGVVIKQPPSFIAAQREQRNLERLKLETTIPSIDPFAVLEVNPGTKAAEAWILTQLRKGVGSIEKLRLEEYDTKDLSVFLNELGEFVAELGNQGVTHGDLQLKNIGQDVTQKRYGRHKWTEFLIFDVESTAILQREQLDQFYDPHGKPDVAILLAARKFTNAWLEDVILLSYGLKKRKVDLSLIENEFLRLCFKRRRKMLGQNPPEQDMEEIMRKVDNGIV